MSLIKSKSNEELWGLITTTWRKIERPRFVTRVKYMINRRIDDYNVFMMIHDKCDVVPLIKKELITEREYAGSKMRAIHFIANYGSFPASIYINRRCIVLEGGIKCIPREYREYRITGKPIGK